MASQRVPLQHRVRDPRFALPALDQIQGTHPEAEVGDDRASRVEGDRAVGPSEGQVGHEGPFLPGETFRFEEVLDGAGEAAEPFGAPADAGSQNSGAAGRGEDAEA